MSFLSFASLQERLVEVLRSKVRNGEATERGLAKLTGISQPHMHNVLKGQRLLSGELADLILQKLNLTTLDLMERGEMVAFLNRNAKLEARAVPIPVLEGLLGPGLPLPRQVPSPLVHTVPHQQAVATTQPVVVQLADDPEMRTVFEAGDYVLLDQSETLRTYLQPLNFYIVNTPAGALVRAIRREANELVLLTNTIREGSLEGLPRLSLDHADLLGLVLARVVWLTRRRRWGDWAATS
ncbi:MAG: hypothetical protein NTV52_08830 [Acidobacteria bacterium]|nr:hypothetical protein [Acidobacteriota bacterium]